uniref:Uncharacterized protein n=1 Tax=Siphoviridae sp. ctFPV4 TaxID=2827819 RepID=A0A8S5SJF2_9CAUD|nr:MAG TPA: hypothetical protein [Siphoviridae sp. ctFPV4]
MQRAILHVKNVVKIKKTPRRGSTEAFIEQLILGG